MRYFPLIWSGVWRKPGRTLLTVVSLMVGFLLFGLLQGVGSAFDHALQRMRMDRLLIDPRFGQPPLPLSYRDQIERVPQVTGVTWTAFLPGAYQDPRNGLLVINTDPVRFFQVRNEYETTPEAIQAMSRTRTGIIVLQSLADRLGWKVGDKVTIQAPIPRTDGSSNWTFDVVGFLTIPSHPGQIGFAVGNYDYFDEARGVGKGTVTRFVIRVADPHRSVEVGNAIDKLFLNSVAPTRTLTENEVAQRQLATIGDVSLMTRSVIAAVFFAILFLIGNTMLQSVRERSAELAVLKTLGFSNASVVVLVIAETLLVCLAASLLGLAAATVAFPMLGDTLTNVSAYVGNTPMPRAAILWGLVFAAALAIVSATIPAWRAMRLEVVDALAGR